MIFGMVFDVADVGTGLWWLLLEIFDFLQDGDQTVRAVFPEERCKRLILMESDKGSREGITNLKYWVQLLHQDGDTADVANALHLHLLNLLLGDLGIFVMINAAHLLVSVFLVRGVGIVATTDELSVDEFARPDGRSERGSGCGGENCVLERYRA